MTATTVFTPSVAARSWMTMQRVAAAVLLIVVFSALAFSIGHRPVSKPVECLFRGEIEP
jgi:hypothetical protein